MFEIAPDRAPPVEVLRCFLRAVAKAIQPAGQCASHFGLQLAFNLLHDLADDSPSRLEHFPMQMASEGQERFEQFHVGLKFFERLFVCDQFAQAVAIERVLFDDLDDITWKEITHLAQPSGHVELGGIKRTSLLAITNSSALVFARIEKIQGGL